MASSSSQTSAEAVPSTSAASSSASVISFSIAKKNQQGPGSVSGATRRESPAGFAGGQVRDEGSDKDLVFSLEEGNIHR